MKVGLLFFRQQLREGQVAPWQLLRGWGRCSLCRDAPGLPRPPTAPWLGHLVTTGMNLGQWGMISPKPPLLRRGKYPRKQRSSLSPSSSQDSPSHIELGKGWGTGVPSALAEARGALAPRDKTCHLLLKSIFFSSQGYKRRFVYDKLFAPLCTLHLVSVCPFPFGKTFCF